MRGGSSGINFDWYLPNVLFVFSLFIFLLIFWTFHLYHRSAILFSFFFISIFFFIFVSSLHHTYSSSLFESLLRSLLIPGRNRDADLMHILHPSRPPLPATEGLVKKTRFSPSSVPPTLGTRTSANH